MLLHVQQQSIMSSCALLQNSVRVTLTVIKPKLGHCGKELYYFIHELNATESPTIVKPNKLLSRIREKYVNPLCNSQELFFVLLLQLNSSVYHKSVIICVYQLLIIPPFYLHRISRNIGEAFAQKALLARFKLADFITVWKETHACSINYKWINNDIS